MPTFALKNFLGIDEAQGTVNADPSAAAAAHNIDTNAGLLATAEGYARAIPLPLPGAARRVMRFDRRTESGTATHILAATDDQVLVYGWTKPEEPDEPPEEPGEEPEETMPADAPEPGEPPGWHVLYDGAASGEWSYVVWEQDGRDVIILANGVDPVKKWYGDTEALEDLGGLPTVGDVPLAFKYLALHKERLWGAGSAVLPDSVFFSRTFSPENWSNDPLIPIQGGGEIAVPTRDGSSVNGLRTVFEDIVIFRSDKVIRIYGDNPENYQQVMVRGSYGPVSNESVVDAGTMCWFWTADGLGYYDGMSTGLVDDRKVTSIIRRVNPAAYGAVSGIMRGNRLLMALPLDGASECTAVLEYDAARQAYMLHEGVAAQDFAYANAMRDDLYMALGNGIAKLGGDTLDGAPLSASWTSPWYDLGDKAYKKTVTRIQAHGKLTVPSGKPDDVVSIMIIVETDQGRAPKRFTLRSGREGRLSASLLLTGTRFRVIVENIAGSRFALDGGIELDVVVKKGGF